MMIIACLCSMFGAVATVMLIRGWTFGINPKLFLALTSTITDLLYNMIVRLPGYVLMAKLIPESVETSMFALLTGICECCQWFLCPQLGVLINLAVGVTSADLQNLWVLYAVQAVCGMIPLLFLWLLPSRLQVAAVQAQLHEQSDTFKKDLQALVDQNRTTHQET